MSACSSCSAAMTAPRSNEFAVGCTSCCARALAAIGAHQESQTLGRLTGQYEGALKTLFGDDYKDGHEQTKAWASRIAQHDATPRENPQPRNRR